MVPGVLMRAVVSLPSWSHSLCPHCSHLRGGFAAASASQTAGFQACVGRAAEAAAQVERGLWRSLCFCLAVLAFPGCVPDWMRLLVS